MVDPRAVDHISQFTMWRKRVDNALEQALDIKYLGDSRLQSAMRHATLIGGKRMRPLLVYATGDLLSADMAALDAPAN